MTNSYFIADSIFNNPPPFQMKTTPTLSFIITSMRTIINKKTHIEAGLFQLILEIIEMNRKVSLQVGVA